MFSKICDFVSSCLPFMNLFFSLVSPKVRSFTIEKILSKHKFKLGDYVSFDFTIDDSRDPDDGKTYQSFGYVVGVVLSHRGFFLTDVDSDFAYYVDIVLEDGLKASYREPELIPEWELNIVR